MEFFIQPLIRTTMKALGKLSVSGLFQLMVNKKLFLEEEKHKFVRVTKLVMNEDGNLRAISSGSETETSIETERSSSIELNDLDIQNMTYVGKNLYIHGVCKLLDFDENLTEIFKLLKEDRLLLAYNDCYVLVSKMTMTKNSVVIHRISSNEFFYEGDFRLCDVKFATMHKVIPLNI